MSAKHLTKSEFLKKVADYENNPGEFKFLGDKPAIVDFYADWCGPCKALGPVLEELAKEYEGKVDIYKVNVDKEQELSAVFGIRSIPTMLFLSPTKDPQMAAGALPKAQLIEIINDL